MQCQCVASSYDSCVTEFRAMYTKIWNCDCVWIQDYTTTTNVWTSPFSGHLSPYWTRSVAVGFGRHGKPLPVSNDTGTVFCFPEIRVAEMRRTDSVTLSFDLETGVQCSTCRGVISCQFWWYYDYSLSIYGLFGMGTRRPMSVAGRDIIAIDWSGSSNSMLLTRRELTNNCFSATKFYI